MRGRYKSGRGGETFHGGVTLELNLPMKDAGPKGMLEKSILGRVRQDRNMSHMLFGDQSS